MIYRILGRTGLRVSLASLETGGRTPGWPGPHKREVQAQRVVRRALELGVNLFDTAAAYGESDAILGRALHGVPRQTYLVATKFTPYGPDGSVITPAQLTASCEQSLRRLQVDTI